MERGRTIALSAARRVVIELMHHARQVPSLPTARVIDVRQLSAARDRAWPRVTWLAIFLRAYGITAAAHPVLRRCLLRYPWPRLYEHPFTIASVVIEREVNGEPAAVVAKIRQPEEMSLTTIAEHLRRFKEAPVREVSEFRQVLRIGAMPSWLRRFVFWSTLHFSGAKRAKRFGTCTVSSLGAYGARQIHPITPLTTYFSVGPVGRGGRAEARIIYDHRVTDDAPVARALCDLEEVLHECLLPELRTLGRRAAA